MAEQQLTRRFAAFLRLFVYQQVPFEKHKPEWVDLYPDEDMSLSELVNCFDTTAKYTSFACDANAGWDMLIRSNFWTGKFDDNYHLDRLIGKAYVLQDIMIAIGMDYTKVCEVTEDNIQETWQQIKEYGLAFYKQLNPDKNDDDILQENYRITTSFLERITIAA